MFQAIYQKILHINDSHNSTKEISAILQEINSKIKEVISSVEEILES